jgi:hypothetical protein
MNVRVYSAYALTQQENDCNSRVRNDDLRQTLAAFSRALTVQKHGLLSAFGLRQPPQYYAIVVNVVRGLH